MEKVIKYLKQFPSPITKDITVYGWEFNYEYHLISSVIPYLFCELPIIENFAPLTNKNRDGRKKEKKYIVIHDTGDTASYKNALFWSTVVQTENNEGSMYQASFQYVVGNDGIYHNIPDDEIAYHAGDSTQFDYTLYDTGVYGTKKDVKITIENGFYKIDDKITSVHAPISKKQEVTSKDFNSEGILCKLIQGKYYIGETYFNETYQKIANRGGNNNGIGMEICINEGDDIYYNFHLAAKLTAYLMDLYHIDIASVKPHHYFSGKDCPMTLRKNDLWAHFIQIVQVEKQMLEFKKEGYTFALIPISKNILCNGRVSSLDMPLEYKIEITYKGKHEIIDFLDR